MHKSHKIFENVCFIQIRSERDRRRNKNPEKCQYQTQDIQGF